MKMALNSSEKDKLFAKVVPVSVKNSYESQPQSRKRNLFLTIEWQESSAAVLYGAKVLSLSLTDNDDPFFLHNLDLNEEEFEKLKCSQDLLINFSSFPQHIIDYIEKCLLEEAKLQPKFLLVFTINELPNKPNVFDIVETNSFKHLTHLSLNFYTATECAVKQYLVSSFRHLKEERRRLQNHLASMQQDLESKLADYEHALTAKEQEIESVKKDLNVQLLKKDRHHQKEMKEERDELISRHRSEETRLQNEIKAKDYTHRKEIQQFESRINNCDAVNKDLQHKIDTYESKIRELKSKIHSLEAERSQLKEKLQSSERECENLHSKIKDKQSQLREAEGKNNDLQRELKNKEQSILKLKKQVDSDNELKKKNENEIDDLKFQLQMTEQSREYLANEEQKLNNIILTLQRRIDVLTKEDKEKGQLVTKHKKTIQDKEKALENLKNEMAQLKSDLQSSNVEVVTLKELNCSLQTEKDKLEKEKVNNDKIIKYLQGKLTLHDINGIVLPTSPLMTSPSALIQHAILHPQGPENTPPVFIEKNAASKLVKTETASPVCRRNSSSSPCQLHKAAGTDSAHRTPPLQSNKATPEKVVNFDPSLEIDQEAISATFGSGGRVNKHSTARKPARTTTPKVTKKK